MCSLIFAYIDVETFDYGIVCYNHCVTLICIGLFAVQVLSFFQKMDLIVDTCSNPILVLCKHFGRCAVVQYIMKTNKFLSLVHIVIKYSVSFVRIVSIVLLNT